jgi:signal transduction histidine kinase
VPVHASEACANAIDNLRSQIDAAAAFVTTNIPFEATVGIESSFLPQVFQNLIGNAIHYRQANVPPRIDVAARAKDKEWIFSVTDNALGIASAHLVKVFQPFQRLHGMERPGSGIGLSTCQRIIERAQGRIWVESQVGKGSTFYFSLSKAS